ncbi:SIS domain-containing protein [Nitrospiraceae bacterium AH_259_D15_M11_P09]|nr:SIS domain-containing protein [Nitrospiraceae bacterium AH_259_D15_M11_P09]
MDDQQFLTEYFERYRQSLFATDVRQQLIELKDLMKAVHTSGRKVIIAGNGGSAAIASHCAVDLTKNARIRCVNFNEPSLVTCLANDYGYERWLEKALELYADDGDFVILISSSGKSSNMVRAAEFARRNGHKLATFTGFSADNPVSLRGHLNFWVDSRAYNIIEMTHQIWLLAVCDLIIGCAEYPAS